MKTIGSFSALCLIAGVAVGQVVGAPFISESVPTDVPLIPQADFQISSEGIVGITLYIHSLANETVTILWDESAFIDPSGLSERLIHSGVRFIERSLQQAPTPVPPGSRVEVAVWPSDRIKWTGEWQLIPISVRVGDRIGISLTWKTVSGKQGSTTWIWRSRVTLPSDEKPRYKIVIGLLPPLPLVGLAQLTSTGNVNKIQGVNILLGFSYREYIGPDGMEPGRFNFYWGFGTIALIIPYWELGLSYSLGKNLFFDLGLFYIIPWINVALNF